MVLLAVLAIRALIALIVFFASGKTESIETPHRASRMALNVVGSIIVIAFACVPALVFPPYEGLPITGDYGVRQAHAIMIDKSRKDPFDSDEQRRFLQQVMQMTSVDKVGLVGHSMGGATSVRGRKPARAPRTSLP